MKSSSLTASLILLTLFVASQSLGQSNSIRLNGGISAHTLLLESNTIAAIIPVPKSSFGLSYSRAWANNIFVEGGLSYTTSQIYLEGDPSEIVPVDIPATIDGNIEADIYSQFIEIPVVLGKRFYTGDRGHINLRIGSYIGYLGGQNTDLVIPVVVSNPFFETTTRLSVSDNSILADRRWDIGGLLGFGYGYDLTPKWRVSLDVRTQLSFNKISNELVPNETGRYLNGKGLLSVYYSWNDKE